MKRLIQHIICIMLLLHFGHASLAQGGGYDSMLDRYETTCSQCIELRQRAASGEDVSRKDVKKLLDDFLSLNRLLKSFEGNMTVMQKKRFAAIGRWFSAGGDLQGSQELLPALPALLTESSLDVPKVEMEIIKYSPSEQLDEKPSKSKYYLLLSLAVPNEAFGVMVGYQYGRWGCYTSFRSNYMFGKTDYLCGSDGKIVGGGKFWGTGEYRRTNMSAYGGALIGVHNMFSVYVGAGYGMREMDWKDIDGYWAKVSDWSCKGVAAETGLMFSYKRLAIAVGISTVKFKTASFTCGLGVKF